MSNYERVDHFDAVEYSESLDRIRQRLENARQPRIRSSPHCIYRTPKLLHMVNEAAYTPRLVSIGPFHYGNENLQRMEEVKDRYLRSYLDRTQRTPEDILCYIMQRKEELKSYYAEITLPDTSFVEMILLDGVFIIEFFLRMSRPVDSFDNLLLQWPDLKSDLFFMQENQLPWFFMEELYNKDVIQHVRGPKPFLDLALSFYFRHAPSYRPNIDMIRGLGVKHLHDLLRTTIIHTLQPRIIHPLPSRSYCLPSAQQRLSATMLYEAGVKFKVRQSKSFLDITFDKEELSMPTFKFDHDTDTFARNLMAYEQCHHQNSTSHTYLCDYFYLMDTLINTSKDVDLLVKSGIIINWLGDNDEVATLVNNLFKHVQIGLNRFYYAELCANLDGHCKIRWNKWLYALKRDYLSTPWKVASTIAAIILLLLTLIQTVCSLISLFK